MTNSNGIFSRTWQGKTWRVSFRYKWLQKFPWLFYSTLLEGGFVATVCFSHSNQIEEVCQAGKPSVLVLSAYQ